jgi:hypothetical protein
MEKIKYDKIIASTTMFIVSEPLEESYSNKVNEQTKELNANLSHINSLTGLKKYISEYSNSLENILCLMDISLEKFKRIISLLRVVKGYSVTSEWDLKKTRNCMLEKSDFMNEVCELLIEGSETKKYQNTIPKFYLENFKINLNVLSRLTNEDDLKRLIKSKMETSYNNDIANFYFNTVTEEISRIVNNQGYDIELRAYIKLLNREVSAVVKQNEKIKLVFDISYMITTSSSQTDYSRKIKSTFDTQRRINSENPSESFLYIVIIDGAGWIGRQSDLQNIYKSCNYFLNLKNLSKLENIVQKFNYKQYDN